MLKLPHFIIKIEISGGLLANEYKVSYGLCFSKCEVLFVLSLTLLKINRDIRFIRSIVWMTTHVNIKEEKLFLNLHGNTAVYVKNEYIRGWSKLPSMHSHRCNDDCNCWDINVIFIIFWCIYNYTIWNKVRNVTNILTK